MTYYNSQYGYSVQYDPGYVPSGSSEKYKFQKGQLQGDPTHAINIYALTAENNRTVEQNEFSGESGWYDWAVAGFPDNGSTAARLSTNKRQETYGSNAFTVINYDPGSSWNNAPFYYLVYGKTVYLITEFEVGTFDDSIIEAMLASFSVTDDASDWQTYTNDTEGYALQYPPAWQTYDCGQSALVWFGADPVICDSEDTTKNISVRKVSGADYDVVVQGVKDGLVNPVESTIEVAGQQSLRVTGVTEKNADQYFGGGVYRDYVFVPKGEDYYQVGYFSRDGTAVHEDEFLTLLNTVQFVD